MFKGNFDLLANLIYVLGQFDISPCSKLVLVSLANHYPNILVKQETIANELGIGLRSVNGSFKELKEKNIISFDKKKVEFTQEFFAYIPRKICVYQHAKSAYSCNNKQALKNKLTSNFQKGEGINYQSAKPILEEIEKNKGLEASPFENPDIQEFKKKFRL